MAAEQAAPHHRKRAAGGPLFGPTPVCGPAGPDSRKQFTENVCV